MNGTCKYQLDGQDTNGEEWYYCTTHDELAISDEAPCNGYQEIPYDDDSIDKAEAITEAVMALLTNTPVWVHDGGEDADSMVFHGEAQEVFNKVLDILRGEKQ